MRLYRSTHIFLFPVTSIPGSRNRRLYPNPTNSCFQQVSGWLHKISRYIRLRVSGHETDWWTLFNGALALYLIFNIRIRTPDRTTSTPFSRSRRANRSTPFKCRWLAGFDIRNTNQGKSLYYISYARNIIILLFALRFLGQTYRHHTYIAASTH